MTSLTRALYYWVAVNQLLELYVDDRVRIEDVHKWHGLDLHIIQKVQRDDADGPTTTWLALQAEDEFMANIACKMGIAYGYESCSEIFGHDK